MADDTLVIQRQLLGQIVDLLVHVAARLDAHGEGNLAMVCAAARYELEVHLGLVPDWRADIRVPRPDEPAAEREG